MSIVPVFDFPNEVKDFVAKGLWNDDRHFGEGTTIGFANEKEGLVAGFVYHDYNPHASTIELSAYSSQTNQGNREFVSLLFWDYPFVQLGCRLLIARHSEHNKRVRRIWKAVGAKEYVIPELRGEGEAEVIAVLSKDIFMKSKFMRG